MRVHLLAGLGALLLGTAQAAAQVAVAPTLLFVDSDSRFGTYFVSNQSEVPQEVTIDFRFGYPVTDSLGTGSMVYGDTLPGADSLSMREWVRAFPRQFVLGPGEQQTVRLTVRPPPELEEGVYWTRIVTTSTPQAAQVDTVAEGVAAEIIFRLEQITTVLYRQGDVSTGLEVGEIRSWVDSVQASFVVPLERSGTAPFFGTVTLRVLGPDGSLVGEGAQAVAVYFDSRVAFAVDRRTLPPGPYTAEFTITAERADIAAADRVPIEPIVRRVPFTVPR